MKTELQCRLGHLPAFGEAMQNATDFRSAFLGHNLQRIVLSFASMDNQRQLQLARQPDMGPKTLLLGALAIGGIVVIQPSFAYGHHFGVFGGVTHPVNILLVYAFVKRVHANRATDVIVAFSNGQHVRKALALDADIQKMPDAQLAGGVQQLIKRLARRQFQPVEMAMGID